MPTLRHEPSEPIHVPTDKNRGIVEAMVSVGIRDADICAVLEIDEHTLQDCYSKEIETGAAKANTQVGRTLFQRATGGGEWQKASDKALALWTKNRSSAPPAPRIGLSRCGRKSRKTSSKAIERAAVVASILNLKVQGWTLRQIAEIQDPPISVQAIHKTIMKAMGEAKGEPVEEMREMESLRLDRLQKAIFSKALEGDLPYVDRVLAIMAQRARLFGLNPATKIETTGADGGPIQHSHEGFLLESAASFDSKLARLVADAEAERLTIEHVPEGQNGEAVRLEVLGEAEPTTS